ncbi:MAG: protein kinase domain-containing protein, partial [Acidimicrobiales bacterium]
LPWLVTPWYDGASVAELLRQGPLPVADAVEATRHAAAALAGLHQAGLLHANLTPAAMLRDAHGEVWVDGMALSTLAPDGSAGAGVPSAHVAPEVLEGSPWSAPGDVWALGSCLHTMLVGQRPWARTAPQGTVALLLAMATGEPPGLGRPEVPPWVAALVAACLAVDPEGRPTAVAVLAGIEHQVRSPSDTLLPAETLLPRAAPEPEGRPLGSSYLLLEPIGSGASGQVWRGRRRWDDGAVAVKVLRPELGSDPEAVVRFLRERSTLVGLDHPNLVRILDLVAEGETLAIVMDLVEGPNLRRVLTSRGAPPAAEACRLLAQVASGLAFAHRAGVVHRDLKPENVLVEQAGTPSARARLTDFGIARTLAGPAVTRAD